MRFSTKETEQKSRQGIINIMIAMRIAVTGLDTENGTDITGTQRLAMASSCWSDTHIHALYSFIVRITTGNSVSISYLSYTLRSISRLQAYTTFLTFPSIVSPLFRLLLMGVTKSTCNHKNSGLLHRETVSTLKCSTFKGKDNFFYPWSFTQNNSGCLIRL